MELFLLHDNSRLTAQFAKKLTASQFADKTSHALRCLWTSKFIYGKSVVHNITAVKRYVKIWCTRRFDYRPSL